MSERFEKFDDKARVVKVFDYGLVLGFAIVCKIDGQDYYDLNVDREGVHKGERIPENVSEDEMLKAAVDFAKAPVRPGNEMHKGPEVGDYKIMLPLTTEIAQSLEIQTRKTGLIVGYFPPQDVLQKFRSGEYTGFSIEGWHKDSELVDG